MDSSYGFEVVENYLAAANPAEQPEHRIVVHDHFAALVSGACVGSQPPVEGEAPAQFATRVIAKAIRTLGPGTGPNRFTTRLTNVLGAAIEAKGIDDNLIWPAASVVCLSAPRREIWRIGTSSVAINEKVHYGTKTAHQAANAFRAVVNAANVERECRCQPLGVMIRDLSPPSPSTTPSPISSTKRANGAMGRSMASRCRMPFSRCSSFRPAHARSSWPPPGFPRSPPRWAKPCIAWRFSKRRTRQGLIAYG